ncbi:MAG: tetratricopeptide repeat protein [Bacteroidota bacterium]
MPQKPNKLIRLWQELKRRKVFRVVTIYAATAYIIIELVNNLVEPLFLPDWTATLILILLLAGLPVVVILSWVFDVTGEGIVKTKSKPDEYEDKDTPPRIKKRLRVNDIVIGILLIVVIILLWPKIFSRDKIDNEPGANEYLTVAVLPFQNMTNDTSWNKWQTGIQANLITSLSNTPDLKIRPKDNINSLLRSGRFSDYFSITPAEANRISQKLRAEMFIYGTIKQSGKIIRINAQLYDTKKKNNFQSFHVDGTAESILQFIDSLSFLVKNYLIIYELRKEVPSAFQKLTNTDSYKAYAYFAHGYNALKKFDYATATGWFSQVMEHDSSLVFAQLLLSLSLINQDMYIEGKKWCRRACEKRENIPLELEIWQEYIHALNFKTPKEEITYLNRLVEIDKQPAQLFYYKGNAYGRMHQFDRVIPELEKAIGIYEDQYSKPFWDPVYAELGLAYHKTGQLRKEKDLYKKALKEFPGNLQLKGRQAIMALSEGDTIEANKYLSDYVSLCKENLLGESVIATNIADIHSCAGKYDKAEKYYRNALSLDPENPGIMNKLACLLIDNEMGIDEGIGLINKALELYPDHYEYLHTKGWALYKKGKYEEALRILEKSWDLKPVYNHSLFLHLEEAKNAVSNQGSQVLP